MVTAQRTVLAGLFSALMFTPSTGLAVLACSDIFKDPLDAALVSIADQLHSNWLMSTYGLIGKDSAKAHELELMADLQKTLKRSGLKGRSIELEGEVESAVEILPGGLHPLSKLADSLSGRGIRVAVAPQLWARDTLGGYDTAIKVLFVDKETIVGRKTSAIMAHELRHAYTHARADMSDGLYERLFSTILVGFKTPRGNLPGSISEYNQFFSLDEILAHRQSAALLLRTLRRNPSDKEARDQLRAHGERFKEFVESGLETLALLRHEIESLAFKHNVVEITEGGMVRIEVEIAKPGIIRRFFRADQQDPNVVGLTARLLFSRDEVPPSRTSRSLRPLLIDRIDAIATELEAIHPVALKFFENTKSIRTVTEKRLFAIEENLREFAQTTTQRRKGLQER